jgi:hypothetical protein
MSDTPPPGDRRWRQAAEEFERSLSDHSTRLGRYCRLMHAGLLQRAYDEAVAGIGELSILSLDERFAVIGEILRQESELEAELFPWPWREHLIVPTSLAWVREHPEDPTGYKGTGDDDHSFKALELDPADGYLRRRLAEGLYMDLATLCACTAPPSDATRLEILRLMEQLDRVIDHDPRTELQNLRTQLEQLRQQVQIRNDDVQPK